ncbi:hypothetical protein [Chitinophaga nivalis]|uniref:Uncharacterized protein n=1 Tax=Chitinophaga nivalis TaxID=2991709 RepID=A0ABT3IS43_9BACT|nr:hypothetical protein [Chitinophaga nivalis]MCW3463532.1 hypothetical protein [Chitinophaga nivalis]MCW3486778.1 hypothetical protein [Chitinophaga nivalis]
MKLRLIIAYYVCCGVLLFSACKKTATPASDLHTDNSTAAAKGPVSRILINTHGIGGYDFADGLDMGFPFDYNSTGKADHFFFYRPGEGLVQVTQHVNNAFTGIYATRQGIGNFDLRDIRNRIFPYDYNSSGKMDHLVIFGRMTGKICIVKNVNGSFVTVYTSPNGVDGFPITYAGDEGTAFDYAGTGKKDHLLFYSPGRGDIRILKRTANGFTTVYTSTTGIGGADLSRNQDRIVGFDYTGSGKADHLLITRSIIGMAWILKNVNGVFTPVFTSTHGIGGFDMVHMHDQILPYDYNNSGKEDHLILYRPGAAYIFIVKNTNGTFSPVYSSGFGIGGYPLNSWKDVLFPYDYNSNGKANHIFLCRPGDGWACILQNNSGTFTQVY